MKKISLFTLLLVGMGISFTSCKDDTYPRLEVPTEFVLNTPAMADQTYIFRDDENYNNLNDITFTVSQPNYGLGTTPDYQVQVAKSEADFELWDEAMEAGDVEDGNIITGTDNLPLAVLLETVSSSTSITIPGEIFCGGVNDIYGFDMDNYNGETVPVAVRVLAEIENAPQSVIWSNAININVSSYIPVTAPGKLYVIGQPTGWDINNDAVYLEETGIGTKIYNGTFYIGEGDFQFRFYSELGDWESYSVGSQDADSPVDISFNADGMYTGTVYMGKAKGDKLGKGSWQNSSWTGGNLEVTVNLKEMTIVMQKAPEKKVYIIGAPNWDITDDKRALVETPAGSNIYKGTYTIGAGDFMLRIYTELGDWGTGSIGAEGGGNPEITLPYAGNCVKDSQANWTISGWGGGDVEFTYDAGSNTINIEAK